jgi:Sulfotransferase family
VVYDAQMESLPVKILYVGGYTRSGSTLVGRVLGEPSDALCLGETHYLWSRGLIDNVECGCGQPFRSCPFWSAVGDEAFGGWNQVDAERLAEIDHVANLLASLPFYWMPWLRPNLRATINDYVARLAVLYAAIARVSGAKMIIETSKDPTFACLLARIPDSDVRIVHLVRDSRAVAYSWTRRRREPSPIGGQQFMPQFSPAHTAKSWLTWNLAFHALSATRSPYLKLTYESFVADPRAALHRLSAFADEDLVLPDSQMTDTEVKLGGHHIFSGNPMRTTAGWLPVRLDTEWQTRLSTAQIATVTAMTLPLLFRYGYPIFPAPRSTADATAGIDRSD